MSATWHPLSTIFIPDPPMLASRRLLEMLLASEAAPEIVYAGDRMWPAIGHGERVRIERIGDGGARPGEVVLATAGPPDLLRVVRTRAGGVLLAGDADPEGATEVPSGDLVGKARLPSRRPPDIARAMNRLRIDLREAWSASLDPDPAGTVREKYGAQAAFYARAEGPDLDERIASEIASRVRRGGTVLVVGSGSGRETIALADSGFEARGIDFAPEMVEVATRLAASRGSRATFLRVDLREHHEPAGSLDAVFFTYDVYSFLPVAETRIAVLSRMRRWLAPGGALFLSARRLLRARDAAMLSLIWISNRCRRPFGDSHSRWIGADGTLRRSFVHVFPAGRLAREIEAAGFVGKRWIGGHAVLDSGVA